ncbi:MAG: CDP-glucose 4,6-dehydratase [Chitinispirillaceae bacterium]|nr:CDP-glucose 4,6-dehydratase [Chitinispirillaceae bacterium]
MTSAFWKNKRVFVTGHTGFKGSWLCLWLHKLGAQITGYSLAPPTDPNLFELANIRSCTRSIHGDVRNQKALHDAISQAYPEIIFHLAAQPLVRDSYKVPVETYETNVMGTVNLLEAIRTSASSVRAVINVTTDKVYENPERDQGFKEGEPLGGYDPYSNSKACSELVTAAYRTSYFNPADYERHQCGVATARAGNVIGGGDWATDRIVPDCIRSFMKSERVILRNPHSTRPWQHVLEPLSGYLLLAQNLFNDGKNFSEAWNFGPHDKDCVPVVSLVENLCTAWGNGAKFELKPDHGPHEASYLKLNWSKAASRLSWFPQWHIETAIAKTASWYRNVSKGKNAQEECLQQIEEYENAEGKTKNK